MSTEQTNTQAGDQNSAQGKEAAVGCFECDTPVARGPHTVVCLHCNPELLATHPPCGRALWNCNCPESPFQD